MAGSRLTAYWSFFLVIVVVTEAVVPAVDVVVVVFAAGAEVDAIAAAAAIFSSLHGLQRHSTTSSTSSERASESVSDEITMLSTSGTFHQCSVVEGLLEDARPCDGLVGAKSESCPFQPMIDPRQRWRNSVLSHQLPHQSPPGRREGELETGGVFL